MMEISLDRKKTDSVIFGIFILLVVAGFYLNLSSSSKVTMVVIDNADPNSMWPTYQQGDIFIVTNFSPEDIALGDVIVYENARQTNIIHRVVDIVIQNGEYYFRVTGDNPLTNDYVDHPYGVTLISYENVLGKIVYHVPVLGHISLAMNTVPIFKILFILFVVGFSLYTYSSDDEEEITEPYKFTINRELSSTLIAKVNLKNTLKFILPVVFLLLLAISPLIAGPLLAEGDGIAVTNIDFANSSYMKEDLGGQTQDYLYQNVEVHMYNNGTDKLERIEITATHSGNEISFTVWKTLRNLHGKFMYGGTLIIHQEDLPPSSTEITLTIVVFTNKQQLTFTFTDSLSYSV